MLNAIKLGQPGSPSKNIAAFTVPLAASFVASFAHSFWLTHTTGSPLKMTFAGFNQTSHLH